MIQPIKQNVNFKGTNQGTFKTPDVFKSVAKTDVKIKPASNAVPETKSEVKPKKSIGGFIHSTKMGFMKVAKGFNNVRNTASGFVRGVREGIIAGTIFGTIGANLLKSKKAISDSIQQKGAEASEIAKNFPLGKLVFKTVTGTISDAASTAWKVIKHLPDIYTKAPKDNLKIAVGLPGRFIKYMGNKKLIALSSAIAVGAVALRTLQGKINANRANANIDHSLNEGHV